ncbi:MAG TPA: ABC transporter ATP-binding protein [Azospirillum sp.]|nr:ABC transporter ATP-binding protein [Azospirillum sp.]
MTYLAPHHRHGRVDEATAPLLRVENLHVEFQTSHGTVRAVEGLSLDVRRGEIMAVVGESGSGKSVTALSIMRLLPSRNARITKGRILFQGRDLLDLGDEQMRDLRGRDISMIFQEPMTSLNPVLSIGEQIMEPIRIHLGYDAQRARARAVELLGMVGIPAPEERLHRYPHEFSGGMRQRVMIAIGLACNPSLIIADEPTTALDVTIQAQILELMKDLSRRLNIALIVITHNLGIVARYADNVVVMYAAKIAERGAAERIFHQPRHPYTMGLLRSVPRLDMAPGARLETIDGLPPNLAAPPAGCRFAPRCGYRIDACAAAPALVPVAPDGEAACHRVAEIENGTIGRAAPPAQPAAGSAAVPERRADLLEVRQVTKYFQATRAVHNVSFTVRAGETLGLVGESGSGKTTIGRLILRLLQPSYGSIVFDGTDITAASDYRMRSVRQKMQVIFQDPFSSLNPRMTIGDIVGEPLGYYGLAGNRAARRERVTSLLENVGLRPEMAQRYPHQLSGGQRQRVGIARALAMEPRFIVCDEAVSALDVSIQGQIINLLEDLQNQHGIAYLFIAHDLAVVRHISDRVAVMYLGEMVEVAGKEAIYSDPLHPYTQFLLEAVPVPDPVRERARQPRLLTGDLPSPLNPPAGCVFHPRCPHAAEECRRTVPRFQEVRPDHFVACHKVAPYPDAVRA